MSSLLQVGAGTHIPGLEIAAGKRIGADAFIFSGGMDKLIITGVDTDMRDSISSGGCEKD